MTWTRSRLILPAMAIACATLGGCAQIDPYKREGIWTPNNANEKNLATMVVDPTELWWGRERTSGTVRTGTAAVERLWRGPSTQGDRARAAGTAGSQAGGETTR